jgi:hypothetical protein
MVFKQDDPKTKSNASKGGKARSQKAREWDSIGAYLLTHGSEKFLLEIGQLEGKEYVSAFKDILEYFKPKLARTESDITSKGDKITSIPVEIIKPE